MKKKERKEEMKTILAICLAAALSGVASGDVKELDIKTCTEAEIRAVAEEILATMPLAAAELVAHRSKIYLIHNRPEFVSLAE